MASVVRSKIKMLGNIAIKSRIVPKTLNAASLVCLPVTIVDQDANLIASVPSGGEYEVIAFSGIDGGLPGTTYTNSIVGGTP